MKDLFSFMPEHENLYWLDEFTKGDDMREHVTQKIDGKNTIIVFRNYGEGNKNIAGEEYEWKYFAGKFKIDDAAGQDEALTYPKKDTYGRVYGIKYEGTEKAYRVMFEQKPYIKDGVAQTNKTFARISRFDTEPTDRFEISDDGTQWNIHKFDWSTPAEIMDMSFAIQALSAKYLAENAETICRESGHMVNDVPLEIDQEVARRKLAYWGCEIDTLTPEQHKYLFGE